MDRLILLNRKFLRNFLFNKNLSEGCWTRGREVCLAAPLAREVCACTHFFIMNGDLRSICIFVNGDLRSICLYLNGDLRYTVLVEVISIWLKLFLEEKYMMKWLNGK